ncbi:hypothetical protein A1Q2_04892 [Trichosporon asahii var. asahii CBS 8904]|uniref:Putative tyrosine-protein phosphatase OCA1 n=1 Tax=Trichosporon asahii var. asahii (strain CBS 8904) TaxID=1220162 RepID=K1V9Q9_TRIAC|nr:hypothetical protein A1Q2_04892 [Trichosporon asahii var. asahii CBS 8904]
MAKIVPPMNFGLVEDGLYRSAQPTELNFSFLEKLNLRTVIWVGAEEPSDILSPSPTTAARGAADHPRTLAAPASEHIPDPRMLQHGKTSDGHGRWMLAQTAALGALLHPRGVQALRGHEVQFIELFDTDLVSITDGTEGVAASG